MYDTYYAMLEIPALRQLGLSRFDIEYRSPRFTEQVYCDSIGIKFESLEAAYHHWVEKGRRAGASWSSGCDTMLKIVLKAKDETYLIDFWIRHHAAIVGLENIIIIDCGSSDPEYISKLQLYGLNVLTFDYRQFYNNIHNVDANRDFFALLAANCRYAAILDADEFLVARRQGSFHASFLNSHLRITDLPMYGGIWLNVASSLKLDGMLHIDDSADSVVAGAIAGKSIVRTDVILSLQHFGHNLHTEDSFNYLTKESFGDIFIVHARHLETNIVRQRALKHMISKGLLSPEIPLRDLNNVIAELAHDPTASQHAVYYASTFLKAEQNAIAFRDRFPNTGEMVCAVSPCDLPSLASSVMTIDFGELLNTQIKRIVGAS